MRKKILRGALGILVTSVVLLWAFKAYRDAHYFDDYDPIAPLNPAVIETTELDSETPGKGYTITKFTFDGFKGEKIPSLISLPAKPPGRKLPAVIFLHGIGQNKDFLKEIASPFNQAGFALASFDQYTQGERKLRGSKSFLQRLGAFGQRPAKTVNETRRLIDHLSTSPDIDAGRIYLVGASYGAVVGSTLMAKDTRVRAGVMVYGGGGIGKLLDSYANHLSVAVLLGLHTKRVLEDGLKWLLEQDDPFRAPEEKITNLPRFGITKS